MRAGREVAADAAHRTPGIIELMTFDNGELRELEVLGRLTRGLLHELANPLVALVGTAQLAHADAEPGSKLAERLALVERTGTEIAEIVRTLQAFVRLQAEPALELSLRDAAEGAAALVQRVLPGETVVRVAGDATVHAAPGPVWCELVALIVAERERDPDAPVDLSVEPGVVRARGGAEVRP